MYWAVLWGWSVPGHCKGNSSAGDREGSIQRAKSKWFLVVLSAESSPKQH